jgi:DNA-binding IscR family transcriptional regulator
MAVLDYIAQEMQTYGMNADMELHTSILKVTDAYHYYLKRTALSHLCSQTGQRIDGPINTQLLHDKIQNFNKNELCAFTDVICNSVDNVNSIKLAIYSEGEEQIATHALTALAQDETKIQQVKDYLKALVVNENHAQKVKDFLFDNNINVRVRGKGDSLALRGNTSFTKFTKSVHDVNSSFTNTDMDRLKNFAEESKLQDALFKMNMTAKTARDATAKAFTDAIESGKLQGELAKFHTIQQEMLNEKAAFERGKWCCRGAIIGSLFAISLEEIIRWTKS